MLPRDFWHVFTQPHTQHLHLDTSVLTKKRQEEYLRMPETTLLVRPRPPDGADPSVLAAGDKYTRKLKAGFLSEEEPLR